MSFYQGTTDSANERFTIGEPSNIASDIWARTLYQHRPRPCGNRRLIDHRRVALAGAHRFSIGANDNLYLWHNPDLSLGEPAIGTAEASSIGLWNLAFDIISIRAGTTSGGNHGAAYFDELRFGTSFADVAPGAVVCDPGDVNCDGMIDVENDFEAIRLHFRRSVTERSDGDLTGDQIVNFDDFREWKVAFLGGGGSLAGLNVNFLNAPEPSSIGLAMLAALSAVRVRRTRHPGET